MYSEFLGRLFSKRFSIEKIIVVVLSIIFAIFSFVFFFNIADRTPATRDDFDDLHEKLLQVENNPEEFMKHKGKITIYDNKIIYEIENDQCQVKATYSLDYELTKYIKKDKATPTLIVVIICFVISVLTIAVAGTAIFILIFIFESLAIGIILLVRKIKTSKGDGKVE